MPGMTAFGHRWLCGTDDLIFMGVGDSLFYLPWSIWSGLKAYSWFSFEERNFCGTSLQGVALASFCCSVTIHWILAIGFICFSMKGSICQVEARLPCVTLFHVKTFANSLDLLWFALSGYVFLQDDFCDNINMKHTLMVTTVLQFLVSAFRLTVWWMVFDSERNFIESKAKKTSHAKIFISSTPRSAVFKLKLRLFSLLYRGVPSSKAMKHAIVSTAEILCYMPRESDIVFSDFAIGIVLMRLKHKRCQLKEEFKLNSSPAIIQSDGTPADCFPTADMPAWMNLLLAKRYFNLGLDVFGLSWITHRSIAYKLRRLWNGPLCFLSGKGCLAEEDCSCRSNVNAVQMTNGVPYKDLIHVSFRNRIYVIPFSVIVDDDTSAVVITIKGAISTCAILTDVADGIFSAMDAGCLQDVPCHGGILTVAQRVRDRLVDGGILKVTSETREGYHLVTTGHNFGASVATLLALLLRPSHPSVRCFAFEPLPCLSAEALETTFDCVFSIVFGSDVIPYIGFRNVARMMQEIVKCAEECCLPKYRVFLWPLSEGDECSTLHEDESGRNDLLPATTKGYGAGGKSEERVTANARNNVEEKEKEMKSGEDSENGGEVEITEVNQKPLSKRSNDIELYIPGKVLHVRHSKNGYRLQICTAKDFDVPMIRPDTVIHHSPQHIEECLEQLGRTYSLLSESL